MNEEVSNIKGVSEDYLFLRQQVLNYTNKDMNLTLEDDKQVYIAVFDIPLKSGIVGFQTQSLALIFGLNTHIYHGSGTAIVELEQYPEIKSAMQSLLISSQQVLSSMSLVDDINYYDSEYVRVYLKTSKGIYFKELNETNKENDFLTVLMNYVLKEIGKIGN